MAVVSARAAKQAKLICLDLQEFTRAINSVLSAKVSFEYASRTISNIQKTLLEEYTDPIEQIAILHSVYQPSSKKKVPETLAQNQLFRNLNSYVSLRERVGAAIQIEQLNLTKAHIQAKLDTLNNYWIEQSARSKVEATISALSLLLALGVYFFWRQWNNYRQSTAYQEELLDVEHERSKLSLALEYAQDTIIITDKEGGVTTWVNKGFEALTGYSFNEAVGIKPGDLLQGGGDRSKREAAYL